MATKLLALLLVIGLTFCVAHVHSQLLTETPSEFPSPAKHRLPKKAAATASPAETATSPSEAESAAPSPKPKRIRRKTTVEASPSPTPTPVPTATPRKLRLWFPNLFKPKRSPSPTPAGVNLPPASGTPN